MPEQHRLPRLIEMQERIERAKAAVAREREAQLIVEHFNARLERARYAGFWPTIRTALTAKSPWLVVVCDSCGTVVEVDLSMKPRDPEASVRVALRDVKCIRCNGHGRPRIIGLASRHR